MGKLLSLWKKTFSVTFRTPACAYIQTWLVLTLVMSIMDQVLQNRNLNLVLIKQNNPVSRNIIGGCRSARTVVMMAVLRIAVALVLIYHLAGGKCLSTSENLKQKVISTSNDLELISSHKWLTCPPWKYHKYNNSSCVCGYGIDDVVVCRDNQSIISLLSCHCMSYSDKYYDGVVVGACPFLCTNYLYIEIDSGTNLSTLCDGDIRQNRQGQMCGKCKDNHSPSPYSYQLKCAHCSHYKYNWLKYLVMAYAPLTVFFVMAIIFRLNALSASMNAIIFFSQMVSSPAVMNMISTFAYYSNAYPVDPNINLMIVADRCSGYCVWHLESRFFPIGVQALLPSSELINDSNNVS